MREHSVLRRSLLAWASGAAVSSLVAPPGFAQGADRRLLRVVAPWEFGSLDPTQSGFVFKRMGIAETLVTTDPDGGLIGELAESWTLSSDRLTWRFRLRSGVRFHDEAPLTAQAVVDTLRRTRVKGPLADAPVGDITADGPDQVVIGTTRPFSSLPAFLANAAHIILSPAAWQGDTVKSMIGSGFYRVASIDGKTKIEAVRNDKHWRVKPPIEAVSYLAVTHPQTRALLAESGDADLVFTLPAPAVGRLRSGAAVDVLSVPIPRVIELALNLSLPALSDLRVRKALSLAIDRSGLATAILRNPRAAATQMMPPSLSTWSVPDLPPLTTDVAEAKRLLAEAGWTKGPDGLLTKAGTTFRLRLRTYPSRPELPDIATAIQAQYAELGIDVAVDVGPDDQIISSHRDGSMQMALIARNFSLVPDAAGTLLQDFGPSGAQNYGPIGWASNPIGPALSRYQESGDETIRAALRREMVSSLQDQLPVIPVAWYDNTVAFSRKLRGVIVDGLEISYYLDRLSWVA